MSTMRLLFAATLAAMASGLPAQVPPAVEALASKLRWYGQDSITFPAGGKLVAVDPFKLPAGLGKADLVLVTHRHDDHYSPADIERIAAPGAVKIAPFDAPGFRRIAVGERVDLGFCVVEAVSAYNLVKTKFHPKSNGWVGYVIEAGGVRVYVTGDTERIPEMKRVRADLMLLPLGQTYTMGSVAEAVEAVKDVKPALAIPIHWGMYEGTRADAEAFVKALSGSGIEARLKEIGE